MAHYGDILPIETLELTESIENSITRILTEVMSVSDGDNVPELDKVLTETLTLTGTYARVWEATLDLSQTLALVDTKLYDWALSRIYSETISLTDTELSKTNKLLSEVLSLADGDDTRVVIVSPEGSYLAIYAQETSLSSALEELIALMEKQGCPTSQTKIAFATDGTLYSAIAIVKRH